MINELLCKKIRTITLRNPTRDKLKGVLRGATLKIKFLKFLNTRKQYIVPSQSYGLSKLGSCLYLQYVRKIQLRLLKNELQNSNSKAHRFLNEFA